MLRADQLLAEIESFRLEPSLFDDDQAAHVDVVPGSEVPRITNELWTARQRQGHSLHELSYRACFKAELPAFFIERLTEPGDQVLDPFAGRGTTPIEAALRGRVPLANDVNPLSLALIAPRLAPPTFAQVEARLAEIELDDPGAVEGDPDLSVFYHPDTLADVRALRELFGRLELTMGDGGAATDASAQGPTNGVGDRGLLLETIAVDDWLRMVATNRLTGHSKGFFSGRTMPPNQAVSVETQRKLNERQGLQPPYRDVREVLATKSRSLLRGLDASQRQRLAELRDKARLTTGSAADLRAIADDSVALTVTSPPFLDVVDYAKDNWLRCWFNGIDAEDIAARITTSRRLEDWCAFLAPVFVELARVTKPGAWVVFEVGEVRGGEVRLEEHVIPVAREAGFEVAGVAIHAQDFTKTANCWGVDNNRKGTNTNRLVLLQLPEDGGR